MRRAILSILAFLVLSVLVSAQTILTHGIQLGPTTTSK